jgi:hypothetical protein
MPFRRLAFALSLIPLAVSAAASVDFNRDVRPILSDKCFYCHGPDKKHREAGLRLDVETDAKKEAIVSGKPEASELIRRIVTSDKEDLMPPPDSGKTLSPAEIAIIRDWVAQGAEYQAYWAYVVPRRHPVPGGDADVHWIDRFIDERLKREGIVPSDAADSRTLARRLHLDLLGLPPAPGDVEAFVADRDPKAYERMVDRLLASRHFGERMAMYWLDLVRYADTVGYHGDQDHAISPYRDYVIDAFNANKPFDQFTREQLAGDLLPDSTLEHKIASGYNRLLQTSHEGGVQEKEYLAIYAADRIRNFSAVWMGATVGCAQCHDHKYDPYTAKDFYSLAAFFADVDENAHLNPAGRRGLNFNSLPTPRPPEIYTGPEAERNRRAAVEEEILDLLDAMKAEKDAAKKEAIGVRVKALQAERAALSKTVRSTMVTVSLEKPRTIRLLPRGNWLDESGPVMKPEGPEFMPPVMAQGERPGRLDLAIWLTDPGNGIGGLTARVQVNRLWYLLFGTGLAGVLDDFGGQGEPPVHPELLDNLAVDFVEQGWDLKRAIRQLVTTRAYRRSSMETAEQRARDPLNRLYARQARYRVDAEVVRDIALSVSGLLVEDIGGPSAKPYQPEGYYRHLNFPVRTYQSHTDQQQWRRGVYTHWQRQYLHPMLKALDAPSREECTAQRPRSNTPTAALTLLNDPSFVEAARVLAARTLTEGGDSVYARLNDAFKRALSRDPDSVEREQLTRLLMESRATFRKDAAAAGELVSVGLAKTPADLDPVELAAWTMVARAILNLNETISRN